MTPSAHDSRDNRREARILDTPNDEEEKERKKESSLFDVLKIIREAKAKRSCNNLDEKYKRFSMNNFDEMRSSVEPLIDLIPREKKEKIDESLTEINTRGSDKKLDKSRKSVFYKVVNICLGPRHKL